MKTLSYSSLINSLLNGATLSAYSAKTEPTLLVKTRPIPATETTPAVPSVPRPWSTVYKYAKGAYLWSRDYVASVKRKLAEAGVDASAWEPAPLPWGPEHVYLKGLEGLVSTYKGAFYLHFSDSEAQRAHFKLVVNYADAEGNPIESSALVPFMSAKKPSEKQTKAGISEDKAVRHYSYKFPSLLTVRIDGEDYEVAHTFA
jgi:hypothetical protein